MELYPSRVGERLGFEAVRSRLAGMVGSSLGMGLVESMGPLAEEQALRELDVVSALQAVWAVGDFVPEVQIEPLDEHLAAARPKGAYLDPDVLVEIGRLCAATRRVRSFLLGLQLPQTDRAADDLEEAQELERAIEGLVTPEGEIRDDASPVLRSVRRRTASARSAVRRALGSALRRATGEGWATEDQPTIRGGRMVIPVRAEAKRKLGGIVHDLSSTGQTAFIEPTECVELNNEVRELEAEERREIIRLLTDATNLVRDASPSLASNQAALARFDVRRAVARLADGWDGIVPNRGDEGVIDLLEARNPELVLRGGGSGEEPVVPLTLGLNSETRILVISGPNAGGKSVAMKTVGLFAMLLAAGIPVPADAASRFDRFDRLLADIGDEQSVEDDLSTFSSRLDRTREMLQRADRRTLVLIDEAGTGTDPQEGSALAQSVLETLYEAQARVVVTTHHATLKRFAHDQEGAVNAMMRFDGIELRPTYRFEAGVPGSSYAFEIADRMGLPRAVVARARELAGTEQVSLEHLLADLEARNQELEREVTARADEARKASQQRAVLETRLASLTTARDQIRGKALDEAEQILSEANAAVERAVREIREADARGDAVKAVREGLDEKKEQVGRAKRKVGRKVRSRSKSTGQSPNAAANGPIGIGDRVRIGGGGPVGEVIEMKGAEAVIAIGPAHSRIRIDRLDKLGGPVGQKVVFKTPKFELRQVKLRLDVRGKRASEALSEVERYVDEALSGGMVRAEILHGKGTGALRGAIQDYLSTREDIATFADASIEEGGAGVTVVQF